LSGAILAVDFGTSTSSAVLVANGETIPIREPSSGSWSWPSAVYRDGDALLVGTLAERRKQVRPALYRAEFKRDLGQDAPVILGDQGFPVEALVTELIKSLRGEAERVHGAPIERAVLTIPASYGPADPRRDLMIGAAESAGFTVVELIPEPVAAALAPPAGEPFSDGDLVLVYDFGGGTFDAALVRMGDFQFEPEVLGHRSLEDCGGRDIDAEIIRWLREHKSDELAAVLDNPDTQSLPAQRVRLELAAMATQLKHQLSEETSAIGIFDRMHEFSLDRDDLVKLAEPIIARTGGCCTQLIRDAGLQPGNVTAILLVGGSSLMPAVAVALAAQLKRPVRSAREPELAVLLGAARFAARAPGRTIAQAAEEPGERAVRWSIPGGIATMMRWLVDDRAAYGADDQLAELRLPSGTVIVLHDKEGGVVRGRYAEPGTPVTSGQWLLTTARPFRPWRRQLKVPAGIAPAVSGESVYVGSGLGSVHALATATGAFRWRHAAGAAITSGAAVANGIVYVGCQDSTLRALDAATGELRWDSKAGRAVMSTPTVSAGMVYFGADDGYVYALNAGTGESFWKQSVGHAARQPVLIAADTAYAPTTGGYLYALDTATGTARWTVGPGATHGQPLLENGTVYLSRASGNLFAFNAADGKQRWSSSTNCATNAVLDTGTVYVRNTGGQMMAFDADTGAVRWQQPVPGNPSGGLALAGDLLYAGSTDQRIYAVSTTDGSIAWSSTAGSYLNSTPVVAGGVVYGTFADTSVCALDALTGAVPSLEDE
jgi:outer membrane protein assembly factor BamB/actin-like ATPase involved in cell morphogenesis